MACKICGRTAKYDLVCESCGAKAAELCDGPMCQFDLWRVRPNEAPSCIPLMNGKCGICPDAALHQVLAGSGKLAYRFDSSNRAVFRTGYHSVVKYTTGWEEGSAIVRDAQALYAAWESFGERTRGDEWEKDTPEEWECSGDNWSAIDEGMDVAEQIADVGGNGDRKGCTLWKAIDYQSGAVIGILIMWPVDDELPPKQLTTSEHADELGGKLEHKKLWHGIRWLVGHPTAKGAGEALMAKADELHRESGMPWMHVISAHASVSWYASRGFRVLSLSECNAPDPWDDDQQHAGKKCGCRIMVKKLEGV